MFVSTVPTITAIPKQRASNFLEAGGLFNPICRMIIYRNRTFPRPRDPKSGSCYWSSTDWAAGDGNRNQQQQPPFPYLVPPVRVPNFESPRAEAAAALTRMDESSADAGDTHRLSPSGNAGDGARPIPPRRCRSGRPLVVSWVERARARNARADDEVPLKLCAGTDRGGEIVDRGWINSSVNGQCRDRKCFCF